MKTMWEKLITYMNIEPDPDFARSENFKTVKLILLIGLAASVLRVLLEKGFMGHVAYGAMMGCGVFFFFLFFCLINWIDVKNSVTWLMELTILIVLVLTAFFDYYPAVGVPAFLFLILLVMLPSMIFDRPWKLLVIVLIAGIMAFSFNRRVLDEAVRNQNIVRIVVVTFLAGAYSTYFSHRRIRSLHMRQTTQVEAEHDPLTGLYNRGGGTMMIRDCIGRHESGTFLIIDIDDFKLVNDRYGHQKGDEVLRQVARTLQSSFMKSDIVMRMGGDEFIIYATGMVDYAVSCKRLEDLNAAIRSVVINAKDNRYVTVSIGGAINDGSYPDYETLYKVADQYLYQTKTRGKDGYSLLGTSFR